MVRYKAFIKVADCPIPPAVVKTSGVNEPCSTLLILHHKIIVAVS